MSGHGQTLSRTRALIPPLAGILAVSALTAWLVAPGGGERDAGATVPGHNGKIAFERSADILVVDPDGSNIVNLTNSSDYEADPAWSPDGQRIAFIRNGLWVMDADGSNQTQLTDSGYEPAWHRDGTKIAFVDVREQGDATYLLDLTTNQVSFLVPGGGSAVGIGPSWSPDGTKIAYEDIGDHIGQIWVADSDGSEPRQITHNGAIVPFWSPDGSKIAYCTNIDHDNEIFVIDPNGSNDTNLTKTADRDESLLSWSPDGTRIVYEVSGPGVAESRLWMMNADGTGQTQFTQGPSSASNPDWQPLAEDPGYAAFELATPTPVPSVTPTPPGGQSPSGFGRGGGNPDAGAANLPYLVAGVGLLVIAVGTWRAHRRWMG
jgi:dipeptidyl aminopeptidase/acylaminoacyl peptidase